LVECGACTENCRCRLGYDDEMDSIGDKIVSDCQHADQWVGNGSLADVTSERFGASLEQRDGITRDVPSLPLSRKE
jgi:hypothetical protein